MFIFVHCTLCHKRVEIDTRAGNPHMHVCPRCSNKARRKIQQKERRDAKQKIQLY